MRSLRRRHLSWLWLVFLTLPVVRETKAASETTVAIIPVHGVLGNRYDAAIYYQLEKPLGKSVRLIPVPKTMAAIRRLHLRGNNLRKPANLALIGERVGATHVLLVEAVGRGSRRQTYVALVAAEDAKLMVDELFPMTRAGLTPALGAKILDQVEQQLKGAPSEAGPTDGAPAPQISVPAPAPAAPADGSVPSATGEAATDPNFKFFGDAEAPAAAAGEEVAPAAGTEEGGEPAAEAPVDPNKSAYKLRPDASLQLGGTLMQRIAHLNSADPLSASLPCYCGKNNNSNPYFGAWHLEGEIFASTFLKNNPTYFRNVGLLLDLGISPVRSYASTTATATSSNTTISSVMVDLKIAAEYRHVWTRSPRSVDNVFQLGFATYVFPLPSAAFPGVAYKAPFIGTRFDIPAAKALRFDGEVALLFALSSGSEAATQLGKQKAGLGVNVGGGFTVTYKIVDFRLNFRYQYFNIGHSGQTSLAQTPVQAGGTALQWSNVKLTDSQKMGTLSVGIHY